MASLHHNRAITLLHLDCCDEALPDCDDAIVLQPTWVKPYYLKGALLQRLGRCQEAMRYFTFLARSHPNARIVLPCGTALGYRHAQHTLQKDVLLAVCMATSSTDSALLPAVSGERESSCTVVDRSVAAGADRYLLSADSLC